MAAWSDSPIKSAKDDNLERTAYAVHAATLIANSHSWDESIVFGLTGPWGSGKSSMLAMITEALKEEHPDWCTAQFTPWATGDVHGLLGDFYASLSTALPADQSKRVRNALGTLLDVAAPAISEVPFAGGLLGGAAKSSSSALKKQTPWNITFAQASKELEQLQVPVLMIADDIDRLQTEELLVLLKVVRLLGRFPGVDYLLAYDEATLFQALSEANLVAVDDGGAHRFMEKIVQYPLVVPPMLGTQLMNRLDHGLDVAFAEAGRTALLSKRLGRLESVFRSLLATPRAIDRFLAQLRHHLPLVAEAEINDEDVVILTLLRTAFPTIYQRLPRWREQLLTGNTGKIVKHSPVEYETVDLSDLLRAVPKSTRPDAKKLLVELFPKLSTEGIGRAPGDRGIAHSRYFDRYFAMGIPAHDISDVEVAEVVAAALSGDGDALREMLSGKSAERVTLVTEKGWQSTTNLPVGDTGDAKRLALAKLLVGAYDEVISQRSFFLSPRDRVLGWAVEMIKGLSPDVSADDVNDALAGTESLWLKLNVVYDAVETNAKLTGWAVALVPDLAIQAREAFLEHLAAGDNADGQIGPGWYEYFIHAFGETVELASAVSDGLSKNKFKIPDLAARFVKVRLMSGATTEELGDFDQESFDRVAPPTPDPFYDLPKVATDRYNLSWGNRRTYAAGRARQPHH